ncbi:MAG: alanine racemase [Eubacterium sp.]|nr:alanine racemase [Eubacterium sp.]
MYYRTQAVINLDAVEYNFNQVRTKLSKNVKILSVVKADAYGHGAVPIAKFLDDKCDFFGVACIDEAMELIHAEIRKPILILGYSSPELFDIIVKNDIRISVFSYKDAVALSDEAVKQNKTIPFHFCVDTGMSRIGFQINEESADICKRISSLPNIKAEGLFSHFATADEKDLTKSKAQCKRFKEFIKMLDDRGVCIPIKHINNSAGIINFDDTFDMCRMGIITYGLYPSEDIDKSRLSIKPALTWKTHISHIKTLEKGREISYGGTYVTEEERVIATIPVGYADGYPRCLSNIGKVIINGKYAPIVGRICMDQFMVDVTEIDNVGLDSEVILVGKSGNAELSMEEVSNAAHSFNYELPCRIALRVPRTYYKNNQFVYVKKYLGN